MAKRRAPTRTSDFGVSRRKSHDSSGFYRRRLYENSIGAKGSNPDNELPANCTDRIFCKSSEDMGELPGSCVHLVVTSPPYNVGKYDSDLTMEQYRKLLRAVFGECFRVLVDGGRLCINITNVGRKPHIPLHSFVIQDVAAAGFAMRGEVIWNKGSSAGASTAWGSWQSASNPALRDTHEYILVFSKGPFSRDAQGRKSTISREQFLQYTERVGVPVRVGKECGPSRAVPCRIAIQVHPAVHVRRRCCARPVLRRWLYLRRGREKRQAVCEL